MSDPWKMLVYMAADNSLYEDAQISLRQITQSSLSTNVEILVQFDGPTDTVASRYRCEGGRKMLYWQAPKGYTTDRRRRLDDFLSDSISQSKGSKRIFLVLWGHGAGLDHVYVYESKKKSQLPVASESRQNKNAKADVGLTMLQTAEDPIVGSSVVLDTLYDVLNASNANRYVKDIDLGRVLLNFKNRSGAKIEILGLDACLMGMAEICHELRESTKLMVASDEDLPKGSWPYDLILNDLAKFSGMDSGTLSTVIISRFLERYMETGFETRISLSSYDLEACDNFAEQFRRLVEAISAIVDKEDLKNKVIRARDFSRTADEQAYIDLTAFCNELVEAFPDESAINKEAARLLKSIARDPYIIYHRDFGEDGAINSYGLALYFPTSLAPEEVSLTQMPTQPADSGILPPVPQSIGGKKNPPNSKKNVITVGGTELPITSYRIAWKNYTELDFNKKTGWAKLVEQFLPWVPPQSSSPAVPKTANPDQ